MRLPLHLGRLAEARQLLQDCQQVFENAGDIAMLATVISARFGLEQELGHLTTARELGRTALRLAYAHSRPDDIALIDTNMAICLRHTRADPAEQQAHRLAAALLYRLSGMAHQLANAQQAISKDMQATIGSAGLPATLAQVIRVAEQVDGVRLGG
jgi:hypothetical protein